MKNTFIAIAISAILAGCASVKMEPKEASDKAKRFATPAGENSGLYTYRDSVIGKALKKNIWLDGKCIGESGPDVFFYTEILGNKSYTLSTASEFSPNSLTVLVEKGKNYFVRQYIKMGLFVGGADLELVPEETGKAAIAKLELATPGLCGE